MPCSRTKPAMRSSEARAASTARRAPSSPKWESNVSKVASTTSVRWAVV
jgi:hypothetical protein